MDSGELTCRLLHF